MVARPFFDDDFKVAVCAAGNQARLDTLAAGVSVFYLDGRRNIKVMEEPSGRKFEIRFVKNTLNDRNYEVARELDEV